MISVQMWNDYVKQVFSQVLLHFLWLHFYVSYSRLVCYCHCVIHGGVRLSLLPERPQRSVAIMGTLTCQMWFSLPTPPLIQPPTPPPGRILFMMWVLLMLNISVLNSWFIFMSLSAIIPAIKSSLPSLLVDYHPKHRSKDCISNVISVPLLFLSTLPVSVQRFG